ncbi:hypothetical protein [Actinokineospora enzanensis]|uniref:hypothetical protein n=1 Tax=Actinokineospora enzanensis TaxID=155975 RepID=UPI00036BC818|nr:hypothetical protein [Actinokineospora enzanensis]
MVVLGRQWPLTLGWCGLFLLGLLITWGYLGEIHFADGAVVVLALGLVVGGIAAMAVAGVALLDLAPIRVRDGRLEFRVLGRRWRLRPDEVAEWRWVVPPGTENRRFPVGWRAPSLRLTDGRVLVLRHRVSSPIRTPLHRALTELLGERDRHTARFAKPRGVRDGR